MTLYASRTSNARIRWWDKGKKINRLILSLFTFDVEYDSVQSTAIDFSISVYSASIYQQLTFLIFPFEKCFLSLNKLKLNCLNIYLYKIRKYVSLWYFERIFQLNVDIYNIISMPILTSCNREDFILRNCISKTIVSTFAAIAKISKVHSCSQQGGFYTGKLVIRSSRVNHWTCPKEMDGDHVASARFLVVAWFYHLYTFIYSSFIFSDR